MPIHQRLAVAPGGSGALKGSIQIVYPLVEITRLEAAVDAVGVDFYAEGYALVHGYGERLGAPHASEARCEADAAPEGSAET